MCRRGRSRHRLRRRRRHCTAHASEREHFVRFPTQTLPALPPPLRNEHAAAGVLGGVAVGAGGSPDTGSARSGSRCAIRSLLRSSVTGHGGGRTAQSHLLLVRSSVLAPSSGRRARGGKVRLSILLCNLINTCTYDLTCTQSRARMWPPSSLSIVSAAQARIRNGTRPARRRTRTLAATQTRHPSCFMPVMMGDSPVSGDRPPRARALDFSYWPLTTAIASGLLPLSAWQHS